MMFNDELQKRHYQIVIENHICTSEDELRSISWARYSLRAPAYPWNGQETPANDSMLYPNVEGY